MKKFVKIAAGILLVCAFAFSAFYVYAVQEYSSADDPLISLSYVNEVLMPQIKELILKNSSGTDITDVVITTPAETTVTEPDVLFPEGTVNTGSQYAVVNVKEGETLFASVTSCEVILRSGSATVVSPFTEKYSEQGVSDTTDGKELYNEEKVPSNHTLLIPRDDGRGILVGEGGAWVMVRGDYIIKTAE